MQEFPHHYAVTVAGAVQGDVELTGERLPTLGFSITRRVRWTG